MSVRKPATKRPVFVVSTVIVSIIFYIAIWSLTDLVIGSYTQKTRIFIFTTVIVISLLYLYWSAIEEFKDENEGANARTVLDVFRK